MPADAPTPTAGPSDIPGSNTTSKRRRNAVWLPDGNLIISVKGAKQTHLHRVHSAILALHSKVFADMVEVASSPKHEQKTIEGCPVVELHDSPQDVYWLLQVIYFPGILPTERLRKETFKKLEPIFLLADKYEMKELMERILPMLERDWPPTLATWDANEAEIKSFQAARVKLFYDDRGDDLPTVDDVFPEPCRVIALARRCGLDSVLPSAFYHLSRIDLAYRPNDPKQHPDDAWGFPHEGGRTANPDHLTIQDWNSLYSGTSAIRIWSDNLLILFSPQSMKQQLSHHHTVGDSEYRACSQTFHDVGKALEASLFKRKRIGWGIDPLAVLEEFQKEDHHDELCFSCVQLLRERLYKKRAEFWHKLPGFFRLKEWANPDPDYTSDDD